MSENTLRVKNLPHDLSEEEKKDFMRHFGAREVIVITSKCKQRSIVYAKFESAPVARAVLNRLHQLPVLNSRLCVEYAPNDNESSLPKIITKDNLDGGSKKHLKSFVNRLNALNNSVSFNQPPPSHLKYIYPKPNRATINNIAHALASIPKFYTQVLHLMNRMNLPPPFSDVPDPAPHVLTHPLPQKPIETKKRTKEDSEESEIESENDEINKEIIPAKRKMPQKSFVKRPKFIKPPTIQMNIPKKPVETTEDVFETVDLQKQSKIDVVVSSDCLEPKIQDESQTVMEMSSCDNIETTNEGAEEPNKEECNVISESELSSNRIEAKDFDVLPVFKSYHPGVPTSRLYIKNLAKTVKQKNLEFIFKRYYVKSEDPEKESVFNIRHMTEGRMKGQAFVTLDNIELAQQAVKETNGYILNDRPMVVVFGKSSGPKPAK